jgi:outer membrane protein OmpA-like peptidoglycan-associated protein
MSDDSTVDSVSLSPTDEHDVWISELFKFGGGGGKLAAAPDAEAVPAARKAGTSGSGGSGATGADTCATPDATAMDSFFDKASSDLTSSDKTFLEAYAKAYLGSKITEPIMLEGFASMEGDEDKNKSLSKDRAARVAQYLIAQKVPKAGVKSVGKGRTDSFSKTDLCQNRRVTIKPELKLTVRDFVDVVETEPRNVPIPGKQPNLSLGEKADEAPVPPPPEPPEMVSRDEVEAALKKWLLELGKSQKVKTRDSVHSTSRVYVAEEALLGRPQGEDLERMSTTPANGDGRGHDAAELAHSIAQNLPDEIPKKNFDNFKKLRPVEAPEKKSDIDGLRDWLDKEGDQILSDSGVPKKYWKDIKDFVREHTPDAIDKLPVDSTVKDLMKKAYDKLNKGGDDK